MSENNNTEVIEAEVVNNKSGNEKNNKAFLALSLIDIILLALGIALLIWADKVVNSISIAIGSLFILYAVYNFIAYFRSEKKATDTTKLIAGIAMIIAGGFLIVQTNFIKEIISFIVGIFIIFESMIKLQDSLKLCKTNKEVAKTPLVLSVISLACGILFIFGKILIPDIFLQILGVMLIVFSFADICGLLTIRKNH